MGRPLRAAPGDTVYHVLNRANARMTLFEDDGDYLAFQRVLAQACDRVGMRLLAYCVMPNHWHLVVWPRRDGDLSHELAHVDAHPALASASKHCGKWSRLSRTIQIVSD